MSHDYTRERQLAAAAAFAYRVARKHAADLDKMFPTIAVGAEPLSTAPGEISAVLWASYLGHLVTHLTILVGREAAASILKQVVAVQSGGIDRAH